MYSMIDGRSNRLRKRYKYSRCHAQILFSLDRDLKSAIVRLVRIHFFDLSIPRVSIGPALRVPLDSGMFRSRLDDTPIMWSLEAKSTHFVR